MSRILFGRFCEQERVIRLHAGLGLEAEAEAAEADDVVFVGVGEVGNSERSLLRTLQIVVEEVVVLEAGFGVPLAVARRHPIQRQLGGQSGREDADIVGAAERGAAERGP